MFAVAVVILGNRRAPSQHSAPRLSDRCLPPKQWVITALHLSGCTHLVWCAASLASVPCHGLAPPVCLPSTFSWVVPGATQMLCLCLALSVCVCCFLSRKTPLLLVFYHFWSPPPPPPSLPSSLWLTQTPQSKEQRRKESKKKKKKEKEKGCSASRGIRGDVIYLPLLWRHDWMFTLVMVWCPSSSAAILWFLFPPHSFWVLPEPLHLDMQSPVILGGAFVRRMEQVQPLCIHVFKVHVCGCIFLTLCYVSNSSGSPPSPGCICCQVSSRIQRWPSSPTCASTSSSVSTPSSPPPFSTSLAKFLWATLRSASTAWVKIH